VSKVRDDFGSLMIVVYIASKASEVTA